MTCCSWVFQVRSVLLPVGLIVKQDLKEVLAQTQSRCIWEDLRLLLCPSFSRGFMPHEKVSSHNRTPHASQELIAKKKLSASACEPMCSKLQGTVASTLLIHILLPVFLIMLWFQQSFGLRQHKRSTKWINRDFDTEPIQAHLTWPQASICSFHTRKPHPVQDGFSLQKDTLSFTKGPQTSQQSLTARRLFPTKEHLVLHRTASSLTAKPHLSQEDHMLQEPFTRRPQPSQESLISCMRVSSYKRTLHPSHGLILQKNTSSLIRRFISKKRKRNILSFKEGLIPGKNAGSRRSHPTKENLIHHKKVLS